MAALLHCAGRMEASASRCSFCLADKTAAAFCLSTCIPSACHHHPNNSPLFFFFFSFFAFIFFSLSTGRCSRVLSLFSVLCRAVERNTAQIGLGLSRLSGCFYSTTTYAQVIKLHRRGRAEGVLGGGSEGKRATRAAPFVCFAGVTRPRETCWLIQAAGTGGRGRGSIRKGAAAQQQKRKQKMQSCI